MSEPLYVVDSRRPVIQLTASPDLRGGWRLELQAVFLDSRRIDKTGIGVGTTAAGIVSGFLKLLQEANDSGHRDVPVASCTLWTVATTEATQ